MRINFILFLCVSISFTHAAACSRNTDKKNYKYKVSYEISEIQYNGNIEKDTMIVVDSIYAINEQEAYTDLYISISDFIIFTKYSRLDKDDITFVEAELLNEDGIDILPIVDFVDRKKIEKEIWEIKKEWWRDLFESKGDTLKKTLEQVRIK